jgi:hypothetical protein
MRDSCQADQADELRRMVMPVDLTRSSFL